MRHRLSDIIVDDVTVVVEPVLRFLGVMITSDGRFAPWRDVFDRSMHALLNRLTRVGLGYIPVALVNGLFVNVMPALLFGAELWGIAYIYGVLCNNKSPYACPYLEPVLGFLRKQAGLPRNSSTAALHRLYGIPTFLKLVLPRLTRLFGNMSGAQWARIEWVASRQAGLCTQLVAVRRWVEAAII